MGDLKDPRAICFKGLLFLIAGIAASVILLAQNMTWTTAFLLAVAIWSFCRLYYFLFYVVEHYVDSTARYSGVLPMLHLLMQKAVRNLNRDR